MMSGLPGWFTGRSRREQRLLLVAGALAVVVLIWGVIVLPITDGLAGAKARQASAAISLGQVAAEVRAVRALERHRPAPLTAPIDSIVRARADAAGFPLASVNQTGADRLQIAIASARPGPLVSWLAGLETEGVLVDSLALTNNGDRTVAAQIGLKARTR